MPREDSSPHAILGNKGQTASLLPVALSSSLTTQTILKTGQSVLRSIINHFAKIGVSICVWWCKIAWMFSPQARTSCILRGTKCLCNSAFSNLLTVLVSPTVLLLALATPLRTRSSCSSFSFSPHYPLLSPSASGPLLKSDTSGLQDACRLS